MRIFNHTSRVVTVKNASFEDSLGMEKSLEVADDRFDFDRTLEIGFLTLKETKSETEVDFVDGFGKAGKQLVLSVERKVDIPIVTVVEVKNEDELHIYEQKSTVPSITNPKLTVWAVACKNEHGQPINSRPYFVSEKDRARFRRPEIVRAAICLPLTLILLWLAIELIFFTEPPNIGAASFSAVAVLLTGYLSATHLKFALWSRKVKEIARSIAELDE